MKSGMTTPTVNNRLLIIRDSINDAKQLITDRSQDFDRMKALWLADLAVDMMLATIVSHLGLKLVSGKPQMPMFPDLEKTVFDVSNPTLSGLLPHQTKVNAVHKQRNSIQHDGTPPSLTAARDCVYGAETFLKDAFKSVFSADLETFSLSDFITFEEARECLKEAEKHFACGDYTECTWLATQAFESGSKEFYKAVRGEGLDRLRRPYSWSRSLKEKGKFTIPRERENKAISEIAEVLELTRFGLDLHRVILFFQIVPKVFQPSGSEVRMRAGEHQTFSIEVAKFILEFSSDALYRMQSFASNYWLPK
jgi:hypothetical protein